MDVLTRKEMEASPEGRHFIPDDILVRLHPGVLEDASAAYAKLVAEHPDYEIGMVRDTLLGGVLVYWRKVV